MCLQNNAQSASTKPAPSPTTSAAKATSTTKTAPAKSTVSPQTEPSKQVTDEEVKTTCSAPPADEGDSKLVRRRRSNVKGGAPAVALATRRATLRSSPVETTPYSTKTSVVLAAKDDPAVVIKRRGRKPRRVLAETTTGTATTDSFTASETASHKQGEEGDNRDSAAETNTMLTEKENSPEVLSEAKDLSTMSEQTAPSSSGDTEEATKPVATRRNACKVTTVSTTDVSHGSQKVTHNLLTLLWFQFSFHCCSY